MYLLGMPELLVENVLRDTRTPTRRELEWSSCCALASMPHLGGPTELSQRESKSNCQNMARDFYLDQARAMAIRKSFLLLHGG